MMGLNEFQPRSGDIPVATGFSWWCGTANGPNAVGTIDVCRAYGTNMLAANFPPVKTGGYRNVAATRLGALRENCHR